ncbi:MAG TPA: SirB2 family protein, partial [Pelomicrobium sp.]|nr:SirB2 family protein [Pelomicrobium sp.]
MPYNPRQPMTYAALKHLHVATVAISYALFVVRGVWMMRGSPMLQRKWVRVLPHVNDTVLLLAGVSLAVMISQYPFAAGWLTAKVLALIVYIGLGMVAIRRGRTRGVRIAAWIAGQLVFAYIVLVAVTK